MLGSEDAMASVTIRNIPPEVLLEMKAAAARNGRSLEGELRDLLQRRYRSRKEVLGSVRKRWRSLPGIPPGQVDAWIEAGRR
jgi:hypothetical protein